MNIRAVIFDVYSTILQVGPPPPNAEELWQNLFIDTLGTPPPLTRAQFAVATAQAVARRHADARARGIPWPEIQWPGVVLEVLPALARLRANQREDFLFRQMQIGRALRLAEGAADCLLWLNTKQFLLGIASNSQAYTLSELGAALQSAGLNLSVFDPEVRFWSFEHGFSKPDPPVFRILSARLEARGITPAEILMVGDRLDNDNAPARSFGWQTWQLTIGRGVGAGNWRDLLTWLQSNR